MVRGRAQFIAIIALAAVPPLTAQGQELTLMVKGHPRLFFTEEDLDRIRAASYAADDVLELTEFTNTYFGGKKVTFALPPAQPGEIEEPPGFDHKSYGHYPYWTGMSGRIEGFLKSLALSYASTGREEFARKAAQYCLSLARWEVWTDPDYHPKLNPCLDTGHITIGVAIAYDVCCDAWREDERATVREGLVRLGLRPLYQEAILPENQDSDANWDILYNGALGLAALALVGEMDDAEAWDAIRQARDYYLRIVEKKVESPDTEGLAYSSSLNHAARFADVLKRVTGDDEFFRHPYVSEYIPRWVAYFMSPDGRGCVNFADAGGYPKPFTTLLKLLSNNYDNGLAGWLLEQMSIGDGSNFEGIIYGNPNRKATPPPAQWPTSALVENIDWAALRSGWEDDATFLAFKCSSSKHGHDHKDAGNFVVNISGQWLATDLGYGSFRNKVEGIYSRGTAGHNCILVDGTTQSRREGQITEFFTSEALDYALGEAANCYDEGLLDKFLRRVIFVKPDYYLIWDELAAAEPHHYQWLLHADKQARWRWDGEEPERGQSRRARTLTIMKPTAELECEVLFPLQVEASYDCWPGTEANYQAFMSLQAPEPAAQRQYVVAITPRMTGTGALANPGFDWGLWGWTVGKDGPSEVVVTEDNTEAQTGKTSVKMVGEVPERDRTLLGQWYLPAQEGALYRASVWVKTESLAGGAPVIDLTFYDAQRKYIAPGMYVARGEIGTHAWQQISLEERAPAGAKLMTFRAGYNRSSGTLWFDDAELVQIDPPPAPPREAPQWQFTVEGDPDAGVFAVRATTQGREDIIFCNSTGEQAQAAGIESSAPVALVRTEDGTEQVRVEVVLDGE